MWDNQVDKLLAKSEKKKKINFLIVVYIKTNLVRFIFFRD